VLLLCSALRSESAVRVQYKYKTVVLHSTVQAVQVQRCTVLHWYLTSTGVIHEHGLKQGHDVVRIDASPAPADRVRARYCWVIQFDDAESPEPKIVKVQSFLDSALVKEIMESDV
jgi:ketosteroid isomerase-like protein